MLKRCATLYELPTLKLATYFGAEGDGEGGSGTGDGSNGGDSGGGASKDPETFSREYVEELRRENAKYRTSAKETQGELAKLKAADDERKKAEMGDLDKARTERDQFESRASKAEAGLKAANVRLRVAVEAGKLNFLDADDALNALDLSKVDFDDDGEPDANDIKKQLKKLAEAKPYLLKDGKLPTDDGKGGKGPAGSGDGAPRTPAGDADSDDVFAALVEKKSEELKKAGMIPIG